MIRPTATIHKVKRNYNDADDDEAPIAGDGGVAAQAAQDNQRTDHLPTEVNLLNPSTPFMRDHPRIVRTGFVIWRSSSSAR